jgi:hypothetical protein
MFIGFLQQMLSRSGQTYANTAETGLFLDRRKPSYVGGILEMANARLYPFWNSLTQALHTGKPQNETKGAAIRSTHCTPTPRD